MVGFLMYEPQTIENQPGYFISRLMIDYRYQHNGYGRAGMKAILAELQARPNCYHISTSVHPENTVARQLYERLGFMATGERDEDKIVLRRFV
jgi:diamine N-acetyltransferase